MRVGFTSDEAEKLESRQERKVTVRDAVRRPIVPHWLPDVLPQGGGRVAGLNEVLVMSHRVQVVLADAGVVLWSRSQLRKEGWSSASGIKGIAARAS